MIQFEAEKWDGVGMGKNQEDQWGGCSFFFLIRNDIRTNYLVSVQFIYKVKSHREHLFSNSVSKKNIFINKSIN